MPVPTREIPMSDGMDLYLELAVPISTDIHISDSCRIEVIRNELRVLGTAKKYYAFSTTNGAFIREICSFEEVDGTIMAVYETSYPYSITKYIVFSYTIYLCAGQDEPESLHRYVRREVHHDLYMQGDEITALREINGEMFLHHLSVVGDKRHFSPLLRCKRDDDVYTLARAGQNHIVCAQRDKELHCVQFDGSIRTKYFMNTPKICHTDDKRVLILQQDQPGAVIYNSENNEIEFPIFPRVSFPPPKSHLTDYAVPIAATVNYGGWFIFIDRQVIDGQPELYRILFYSVNPPQSSLL